MSSIILKGLRQNNLKDISLTLPKNKLIVFTGVSGSGKSSIVFDTIGAESQRLMNELYPAFIRGRLPKYLKPDVDLIENLSPSVIVDQSSLGGNARSTVGTISEVYSLLRLLFSRIGYPQIGTASCFSFNHPEGMCPHCSGLGKVMKVDMSRLLDMDKSWKQGCVKDSIFKPGSWTWKQYAQTGFFDLDKPLRSFHETEWNLLMYGAEIPGGELKDKRVDGLYARYQRIYMNRDLSGMSRSVQNKAKEILVEQQCEVCSGKRLQERVLHVKVNGYSIYDMCMMELTELVHVLQQIKDPRVSSVIASLTASLNRMITIGLSYLHLNRETVSLSGGEAQRLKLVKYMGSSLSDMLYIFDEPSTGLHPRDVYRMNQLLLELRDKGNTVLVVEHDKDVIAVADEVIDIGPHAGKRGGEVLFQGTYEHLLETDTLTARALCHVLPYKDQPRQPRTFLPIRKANLHNLKNVDVDIPLGILTVITGVAGSGKSTLITKVFQNQYKEHTTLVDQSPITANSRSNPASYLDFLGTIRKLFAQENGVEEGMFSYNSTGACPICKGRGVVVTELVFMDPVVNVCEHCHGLRFHEQALQYRYKGKSILDVLSLTVEEAIDFFDHKKIRKCLQKLKETGLSYLTLGQPMDTLSGGERQRIKLAKNLDKKGSIYILDEPTTGLHMSDIHKLLHLFDTLVEKGNTVIVIEHNLDVAAQADWVIDVGPDGGRNGGEIVFSGTIREMLKADTITAEYFRRSLR